MIASPLKRVASISAMYFLILSPVVVSAHVPHDDIFALAISPTYNNDRTVFVNVRRNLFKSTDGGESWIRLVKGLDNKGFLGPLTISPQTRDVLYAAAAGDGVYRSTDSGDSWAKVNNGLKNLNIDRLYVSPHSAALVLASGKGGGLYKTSDGGKSWHEVMPGDAKVTAAEFSSERKGLVIAGTDKGSLLLSNDEGESWKKTRLFQNSGGITTIAYSPFFAKDRTFYIGTGVSGIFWTTDGGESFREEAEGLTDTAIQDIQSFPISSSRYGLMVSTRNDGVFRSLNEGRTWQRFSKGLTRDFQAEHPDLIQEKGLTERRPHFSDLRISDGFDRDKTVFLAGFDGLFKSADGGHSWKKVETYPRALIVGLALSPDYKNDSTLAVATYAQGAFVSNDAGATWKHINRDFKSVMNQTQYFAKGRPEARTTVPWARIYNVIFGPERALYFSLIWSEFNLIKIDKGRARKIYLPGGGNTAIAFSPAYSKEKTMYLASQAGDVFVSTDAGMNFKKIGKIREGREHDSITLVASSDLISDKTMFFADDSGIYKTEDGGVSWYPIAKGTAIDGRSYVTLAISPDYKSDMTLVAGTDKGVYKTEDAGRSWSLLGNVPELTDEVVEAVAISPDYKNDKTFLVSMRGKGLFKTEDGGASFKHIGNDTISLSRVNAPSASMPIQFSPSYAEDRTIYGYGAADCRIYRSSDGGLSWRAIVLPRHKETILDKAYDWLLIAQDRMGSLKETIKEKLAALIVEAGKYKRKIWPDTGRSAPRQWRSLQYEHRK